MTLRRRTVALLVLGLGLTAAGACGEAQEAADPASFCPQPTPEQALRTYMRLLELRVKAAELTLFTPETRRLGAGATGRDSQQESELRALRSAVDSIDLRSRGSLAVIRFGSRHRHVPPYFFRRGADGWMLDLATPRRVLVFNQANEWAFRSRDHEFAFDDG